MAHPFHNAPYSEEYQTATYNGFPFLPEFGTRRSAPAEEPFILHREFPNGDRGWYQGNRKLNGFKSKKYWVRPSDGARRGTMGRLKDALTGEGPDVYVVANGDRRTLHRDRPRRSVWSGWERTGLGWLADANWRAAAEDMDCYPSTNFVAPWAGRSRERKGEVYNFRTREFERLTGARRNAFWSDAHYGPRGKRGRRDVPQCFRRWDGEWVSDVPPTAGLWAGGRPLDGGGNGFPPPVWDGLPPLPPRKPRPSPWGWC